VWISSFGCTINVSIIVGNIHFNVIAAKLSPIMNSVILSDAHNVEVRSARQIDT
jgi:hypothetical protein